MSGLPQAGFPAYYDGDTRALVPVPLADLDRAELETRAGRQTSRLLRAESFDAALADLRATRARQQQLRSQQ